MCKIEDRRCDCMCHRGVEIRHCFIDCCSAPNVVTKSPPPVRAPLKAKFERITVPLIDAPWPSLDDIFK